jgi:hypothetical protein
MTFTDAQIRALSRNIPSKAIRSRTISGKELAYVEGWYVLTQANRIFGFDGWNRESLETRCVLSREARGRVTAIYSARVRITVRAGGSIIVRDGHGTGEAYADSAGEAHDRALKAAETDATKRALATFGRAFGLALYSGKTRSQSVRPDRPAAAAESSVVEPQPPAPATLQSPRINGTSSIDKGALTYSEPHRVRDKEHLRFVASQPCLICGARPCDAHHLRFAQPRAMGRKVGDQFTVPLCRAHHDELHQTGNEAAFWHEMGIDAFEAAADLWSESQAPEEAREKVSEIETASSR